jgi:chemotaxis protein methyltransferase CheR
MCGKQQIILDYLRETRGIDFSRYHPVLLEKQFTRRLQETGSESYDEYLIFLQEQPEELHRLLDALLVKYSLFFRDPLVFEMIGECVLPQLLQKKMRENDHTLRIWSAGCATGEEPYSMAIVLNEWKRCEVYPLDMYIFATDVDENTIEKAQVGVYTAENMQSVKYGLLRKYFVQEGHEFRLRSEIKCTVAFSVYDLTDPRTVSPPDSIFGHFDLVLCRNVIIYFQEEVQTRILQKLSRSLSKNGFLVLGESESIPEPYQRYFREFGHCCKIYEKTH